MKKIVSLVLALVLVLAIAAPATAITGMINPEVTASTNAAFTNFDLKLVESYASGVGVLSLQGIAANKAYVKDSLVHYAITYTTPDLTKVTTNPADYDAPAILLTSDVVKFYNVVQGYSITTTGVAPVALTATLGATDMSMTIATLPDPIDATPDASVNYIIVGSGVLSVASNGTIMAQLLGDPASPKFMALSVADFQGAVDALEFGVNIYTGPLATNVKYEIIADETTDPLKVVYTVTIPDADGVAANHDGAVIFTTNKAKSIAAGSSQNVEKIEVQMPGVRATADTYLVFDQANNVGAPGSALKFYSAAGSVITEVTTAATISSLTSIYSGVMSYFGFNFNAAGILHPVHFANKLSVIYAVDQEAITLYTSSIVVPDEDTEPPQTGDAATSIGFVMIALAIVAAAGVAYKKVRA